MNLFKRLLPGLLALVFIAAMHASPFDKGLRNARIESPETWLGSAFGREHMPYDQLVEYIRYLAENSDRLKLEEAGASHENRPMLWVTVSSPENLSQRDEIRKRRLRNLGQSLNKQPSSGPVVVMLAYSIHGNESSGAYASCSTLWHLASTQEPLWMDLLNEVIILVQPCQNPDGFDRFVSWARSRSGRALAPDPWHWEHREDWPGGRGNHYWFDLNRDWLPVVHPESLSRLRMFHFWLPEVVSDFHEMGSDSTYFFQPGVPSRKHPLTPDGNVNLTSQFAQWHARVLDEERQFYFTEERFDDFYYGKGSTYPDILGSIGILFEQASTRGRAVEGPMGDRNLARTIRNQFLTSLSTLRAAYEHKTDLQTYHSDFLEESLQEGRLEQSRAIVFGDAQDRGKTWEFARLMRDHGIELRELSHELTFNGQTFQPGRAFVIPLDQMRYRLLQALWETRTEFDDTVFYDISTWTLPLAWNMPWAFLKDEPEGIVTGKTAGEAKEDNAVLFHKEAVAYALTWEDTGSAPLLAKLLNSGVMTRVAQAPFKALTGTGERAFGAGTLIIPVDQPELKQAKLEKILKTHLRGTYLSLHSLISGLTPEGIDLGSGQMVTLDPVIPAIVVGEGVNAYEAGEVWHHLDLRLGLNPSLLSTTYLESVPLERYTHLIMVQGSYGKLSLTFAEKLKGWIERGGVLIAQKSAVTWALNEGLFPHAQSLLAEPTISPQAIEGNDKPDNRRPYASHEHDKASQLISGCILGVDVDLTHPLGFGFTQKSMAVFRNSRIFLSHGKNPYATVARYTEGQPLSGYLPKDAVSKIEQGASVLADRVGAGTVVLFVDNPCFRGFWRGTSRFMDNALFFGPTIKATGPLDAD